MEISLVNDLLGVIALYSTTVVIFNLLTVSRYEWRRYYTNSFWRQKLRVETSDQLVADDVIGKDTETWFRYYLARNRTFWGSVIRLGVTSDVSRIEFVSPESTVLTASLLISSRYELARSGVLEHVTNVLYQIADLSLVRELEGDIEYIPFGERIRDFQSTGDGIFLTTERGNFYQLEITTEDLVEIKPIPIPGSGIVGISEIFDYVSDRNLLAVLRRDGVLDIYDRHEISGAPVTPVSTYTTGFVQISRSWVLLGSDGIEYQLEPDPEEGPFRKIEPVSLRYYDVSGQFNAPVVGEPVVIRTSDLYFLANRDTIQRSQGTVESHGRTQYISQLDEVGLIVVD